MLSVKDRDYVLNDEEIDAALDESLVWLDEVNCYAGHYDAPNVVRDMIELFDDVDEKAEEHYPDDWESEAVKWPEPNIWHTMADYELRPAPLDLASV